MKVRIVGAGPSGSVAAISAIRAGHEVEMFEEHEKAGYPQHCSGLVSKEGLESLKDMIDYEPFVLNRISSAVLDFAGERFEIRRKSETACVIDRAAFDHALAQQAEREGATIRYGTRYVHKAGNPEPETIIGADGPLSATAAHFGFQKIRKYAFTLKAHAKVRTEDPGRVFLFYDNSLFPGFFGWLIPYNEYEAEVGMGTTSQMHMKSGFAHILKITGAGEHGPLQGRIIPLEPRAQIAGVFGNTNVLLAGDAAGQVKASSGGGIVFGTAGARLAGALAHSPHEYRQEWERRNSADMLAHRFLQNFFALQPGFVLRLTSLLSKRMGLDYFFSLHGDMDRPTRSVHSFLSKVFNSGVGINVSGDQVGTGKDI